MWIPTRLRSIGRRIEQAHGCFSLDGPIKISLLCLFVLNVFIYLFIINELIIRLTRDSSVVKW